MMLSVWVLLLLTSLPPAPHVYTAGADSDPKKWISNKCACKFGDSRLCGSLSKGDRDGKQMVQVGEEGLLQWVLGDSIPVFLPQWWPSPESPCP